MFPPLPSDLPANWNIPETQWVTWGGQVVAPGDGLATKDTPFAEVARLQVSTPRLIFGTVVVLAAPLQSAELQLWQGLGRVELFRTFVVAGGGVLDLQMPCRIVRVTARELAGSPAGDPITVQAVLAPTWPDPDMRRGAVLR